MSQINFSHTFQDGDVLFGTQLETMKSEIIAPVNGGLDDGNIAAAADIAASKIGDVSVNDAEMQSVEDPYPSSVISKPTTLVGEIKRLRFMLKTLSGQAQWYIGSVLGVTVFTTGDMKATWKLGADTGWVLCNDGTIGNVASNGTTRNNADTAALFALFWNNYSNTICPVFDSAGTASTRGATAALDYAANKAIRLPLMAGRVPGIAGTPAAASRVDAYTGTQGQLGTIFATDGTTTVWSGQAGQHSTVDDDYNGLQARMLTGTNANTNKTISDYDGGLTHFTTAAYGGTVDAADTYQIFAGTNNGFLLPFDTSPTKDDALNGYTIEITGGTASGASKTISDYDGSSRLVTVSVNWSVNPDHTSTFSIYKTIPTRTVGDQIGTDVRWPSLSQMPAHTHPTHTDDNVNGTRLAVSEGDTNASEDFSNTTRGEMGAGSSVSVYQPTIHMNWMVKL